MGFALPLAWGILARIGVPLLLTAGAIAGAGALIKSQVPSVPISKKNLGISALVGGAGMAAYFMSDVIPAGWRPVSYAAAAAGIAGSIYLLFTEDSPSPPSEISPPECPNSKLPMASSAELKGMLTMSLDPGQLNTGGLNRSGSGPHEFDLAIRNETNSTLCFFVGLETSQASSPRSSVYTSRPNVAGPMGRMVLTLAAHESKTIRLATKSLTGWHTVEIQIFRNRDDIGWKFRSERLPFFVWGLAL